MADMADHLGVHPNTLRNWMGSDRYRTAYEEQARHIIASPDRMKLLADRLFALAAGENGDRQAINDYMSLVHRIDPPEPLRRERAEVADMSDEALLRLVVDICNLRGWAVTVTDAAGGDVLT